MDQPPVTNDLKKEEEDDGERPFMMRILAVLLFATIVMFAFWNDIPI